MNDWKRQILVTTAFVCCVVSASAQQSNDNLRDRDPSIAAQTQLARDLQNATFHRGAWYLSSKFLLSDIGVDDAFYSPTQDQTSGVSFGIQAPQTLYFVPVKKIVLSTAVTPSYNLYDLGGLHTRFGYTLRADARFLLNHAFLDFYATSADQLRANSGELNRLVTLKEKVYGLNSELKYSSRTSVTLASYLRTARFSDAGPIIEPLPVQNLSRDESVTRVAVRHRTFPLTTLSAIADLRTYRFDSHQKDSRRDFAGAGAAFDNGRNIVQVEAGLGELRFKNPSERTFRGGLGNVTIQRLLRARLTGTVSGSRDIDFSLYRSESYYILDRGSAVLEYSPSRRLTLNLSTNLGRDVYETPPKRGRARQESYSYTSAGWLYGLRRLRFGFDVGYYRRTSNFSPGQKGIRTVLHLSFTP